MAICGQQGQIEALSTRKVNFNGETMLANNTGQHMGPEGMNAQTYHNAHSCRLPCRAASPVLTHQGTLAAFLGVQVVHV